VNDAKWLAIIGDVLYNFTLKLNRHLNSVRHYFGYEYFALSAWLKRRIKLAVNFVSDFEKRISEAASKRKLDGVICGHVHHAESRKIGKVDYLNCGDWVESCTALVENVNGEMQLVNWSCSQKIKELIDAFNKKNLLINNRIAA
jgi:UDP-2,3-diacylglucosamine pyrophosphatase LpxH